MADGRPALPGGRLAPDPWPEGDITGTDVSDIDPEDIIPVF